jgi:hypothetical protein
MAPNQEIKHNNQPKTRAGDKGYRQGGSTGGERRGSAIQLFGGDQTGQGGKKLK